MSLDRAPNENIAQIPARKLSFGGDTTRGKHEEENKKRLYFAIYILTYTDDNISYT